MKILVIGASGMLAKPVIKKLDKEGFQLRLFSRTVRNSLFEKDYDIIQGNVFNVSDLDRAMSGCDAVHISLSNIDEAKATEAIIESAKKHRIKIISYVSGCTVSNENRWFKMIDNKYRAEQTIIESGISYIIFRPTWFFESLDLMVRNGKAIIIGKQPNPSHWVAADDFARMIATAYKKSEALNKMQKLSKNMENMKSQMGQMQQQMQQQNQMEVLFEMMKGVNNLLSLSKEEEALKNSMEKG